VAHEWIDDDMRLREFVDWAAGTDLYFMDTEFHRERTYFPQLALVQIAVGDRIVLIDPAAADASLLRPMLEGPGTAVLHAAQQDLDVLAQSIGCIPARMFDTQIAAGFVGFSSPSLATLVSSLVGASVPKGDRLTDWLRRPLTADQRNYAASDVLHLPELHRILGEKLAARGRRSWSDEACEELRTRPTGPARPGDAWLKVKDVRTLKGRARWVAREICIWREERAMDRDIPVRHVLSDISVLGVAQRAPRSVDELASCRGLDRKLAEGRTGAALLDAVERGIAASARGDLAFPAPEGDDLEKELRHAVTLVGVWVAELARQSELDPTLLGTRRDIVDLLSRHPSARLAHGWRAEILGRDVELLIEGKMALTFRRDHDDIGLRMVPVDGAREAIDP
jgi:ribonuclease D